MLKDMNENEYGKGGTIAEDMKMKNRDQEIVINGKDGGKSKKAAPIEENTAKDGNDIVDIKDDAKGKVNLGDEKKKDGIK